jgi:hypothetical protein
MLALKLPLELGVEDQALFWLGLAQFWLCLLRMLIMFEIIKMEPKYSLFKRLLRL